MEHPGLVPIRFRFTIWAATKNVACTPCADQYALAFPFRPTGKSL